MQPISELVYLGLHELDWDPSLACESIENCQDEAGFRLVITVPCEHKVWLFCKGHTEREQGRVFIDSRSGVVCPLCDDKGIYPGRLASVTSIK